MFIQERNIELNIGLKRNYKLIHFSDVHVITYDEDDSIEAKEKAINQEKVWIKVRQDFAIHFHESYSEEQLIPSTNCLDNLIEYANNAKPDGVLLTGDIIDYYSKANYAYLKKSLSKLNSPYLFSCGNHETPSSLYNDICKGNGEVSYHDFEEFIIVSLDDSKKKIKQSQLDALESIIKLNKPIILAMHIPVMSKYNELEMKQYDSYYIIDHNNTDEVTSKFIKLIISEPLIKAIFCGHTHGASVSYFSPNKPQHCASSGLIGFVNNVVIK